VNQEEDVVSYAMFLDYIDLHCGDYAAILKARNFIGLRLGPTPTEYRQLMQGIAWLATGEDALAEPALERAMAAIEAYRAWIW